MNTHRAGEDLIQYQIIDFSNISLNTYITEPQSSEDFFRTLVRGGQSGAIEFRGTGKNLFFILRLFLFLRRKATEIVYREKDSEPGVLIFSIYDINQVIRPHWVKDVLPLTEKEENTLKKELEKFTPDGEVLDILLLWKKAQERVVDNPYSALVFLLEEIVGKQESVKLEGIPPIAVALFVVNYLVATKHEVTWNGGMLNNYGAAKLLA